MSKSDVTQEQARALIDRVSQEIGLLVADTSGFIKVQGPANKHRLYVQKSRTLNRIETTVPLATDDPAYVQLPAPNGSVACKVLPTLEHLERVLRMLGDASLSTQVPNKPRPFAATKAPPARKPKPVALPVPEAELTPVPEGGSLKDRLAFIHERARKAKVRRYMENNGLSEADAEAVVDGKVSLEDLTASQEATQSAEALEVMAEAGIEAVS